MIDTLRIQWAGTQFNEGFHDWLLSEFQTPKFTTSFYTPEMPWQGVTLNDEVLGTIGLKSSKIGNFLTVERSLPKFLHGDNCRVLSVAEMIEGTRALMSAIEARFAGWWLFPEALRESAQVKRLDLCYQQQVPSSPELFAKMAGCIKHRNVRLYLSGLDLHQNRWEHARWYDKGVESGNESYLNVVRHEEQIRAGKAAWLLDVSKEVPEVNVEAARERMNDRYLGWEKIEGYEFSTAAHEHGVAGLAAAFLALHPEYEGMARYTLSKSTYYRVRNVSLEIQRRQFSADLRLPENAWAEPMVL